MCLQNCTKGAGQVPPRVKSRVRSKEQAPYRSAKALCTSDVIMIFGCGSGVDLKKRLANKMENHSGKESKKETGQREEAQARAVVESGYQRPPGLFQGQNGCEEDLKAHEADRRCIASASPQAGNSAGASPLAHLPNHEHGIRGRRPTQTSLGCPRRQPDNLLSPQTVRVFYFSNNLRSVAKATIKMLAATIGPFGASAMGLCQRNVPSVIAVHPISIPAFLEPFIAARADLYARGAFLARVFVARKRCWNARKVHRLQ